MRDHQNNVDVLDVSMKFLNSLYANQQCKQNGKINTAICETSHFGAPMMSHQNGKDDFTVIQGEPSEAEIIFSHISKAVVTVIEHYESECKLHRGQVPPRRKEEIQGLKQLLRVVPPYSPQQLFKRLNEYYDKLTHGPTGYFKFLDRSILRQGLYKIIIQYQKIDLELIEISHTGNLEMRVKYMTIDLTRKLELKIQEISGLRIMIDSLKATVDQREQECRELREKLLQFDKNTNDLVDEITQLKQQYEQQCGFINQQELVIKQLKHEKMNLEDEKKKLEEQLRIEKSNNQKLKDKLEINYVDEAMKIRQDESTTTKLFQSKTTPASNVVETNDKWLFSAKRFSVFNKLETSWFRR